MTVTAAELERRLLARRRQRQGRRISLLAAAVAAIAIGSIVAVANGWIGKPSAVVGTSPDPSATAPVVVTPAPSAVSVPTTSPSPSAPIARVPFGRADDTILVSQRSAATGFEVVVTIVHEDMTTEPGLILSEADFPAGTTVSFDPPPRVSVTGYLLVSLGDVDQNPAGAAVYDLLDPTADPRFFSDPSIVAFAWGPTGLLAADDTDKVVISDPADPAATPQVVPIAEDQSLTTFGPYHGIAWTADGQGFVADQQTGRDFARGVLALDGTFSPDDAVAPFASTGLERATNLDGQWIGPACDQVGSDTPNPCHLVTSTPDSTTGTSWYTAGKFGLPADQVWAADASRLWVIIDEHVDGAPTRTLRLQLGGPKTYTDVAVATDVPVSQDLARTVFAGLMADDSRIAIDLGTGQTLLVDRITGNTVTFDGTFAGWGDPSGFIYPNPEAP